MGDAKRRADFDADAEERARLLRALQTVDPTITKDDLVAYITHKQDCPAGKIESAAAKVSGGTKALADCRHIYWSALSILSQGWRLGLSDSLNTREAMVCGILSAAGSLDDEGRASLRRELDRIFPQTQPPSAGVQVPVGGIWDLDSGDWEN